MPERSLMQSTILSPLHWHSSTCRGKMPIYLKLRHAVIHYCCHPRTNLWISMNNISIQGNKASSISWLYCDDLISLFIKLPLCCCAVQLGWRNQAGMGWVFESKRSTCLGGCVYVLISSGEQQSKQQCSLFVFSKYINAPIRLLFLFFTEQMLSKPFYWLNVKGHYHLVFCFFRIARYNFKPENEFQGSL